MQVCRAVTKKGTACKAAAGATGLCSMHEDPERAKAPGTLGGKQNRRSSVDLEIPEGTLALTDLCNLVAAALRKLIAGDLSAKDATAVSQLCNLLLKMHPTAILENELCRLRQQLAEAEMGTGKNPDFLSANMEKKQASGDGTGEAEAAEAASVLASPGRNGSGNHN